ncbi:hypothetical protein [Aggregatilinea lenta]|uniref:hypothetical protein n=1 Tax=Aggregatilinea lenta TaxID=913108 RepID=UPI000E5A3487|nr:hypothetical protein [Aggregatilinea lenta]
MMRTRFVILLAALALLVPFATASAQGGPSYPLAAISGGNVYLFGFGDAPIQVTGTPAQNTLSMAWSPSGQYLAFTRWDENYALVLWLYDQQAGGAPVQVASGLTSGLPVTFSADNQLVYAVDTGQFEQSEVGPGGSITDVYTFDPATGTPQQIGTFTFGVGCGGGSSSPADWRYWAEAGTGPGIAHAVFALTPEGLVYSMRCTGSGVALLNMQSGASTVLSDTMGNAVVSPDGMRVAGVADGQLAVIDLATGQSTPVASQPGTDQVAWGADGTSLFYSTRQETGRTLPATPDEQQQLAQALGASDPSMLEFPVMTVGLYQVALADGTESTLYISEAYAIGRILPTPDGAAVLFSEIPNLDLWVQQVISGQINPTADVGQQQLDTVPVTLFALSLVDGSVTAVGTDLNQAVLNTAAYGGA